MVDDGTLFRDLLLFGDKLQVIDGCALKFGAVEPEGETNGGIVNDRKALGDQLLLGAEL